jgi:hypothetical protein
VQDLFHDLLGVQVTQARSRPKDHAVGQGWHCQGFNIVWQNVIAAVHAGTSLPRAV